MLSDHLVKIISGSVEFDIGLHWILKGLWVVIIGLIKYETKN